MAIKDKDGNVYKLRGPNPLMKDQNRDWDKSQMKFFNFESDEETVADNRNPVKEFKEKFNVVDIGEELDLKTATSVRPQEFLKELVEPEVIIPAIQPVVPAEEKPVLNVDTQLAKILKERGVEYYCTPVIAERNHHDDLYDTSHKTFEYGKKTIFDAIIIDQSDLQLQFWCIKEITPKSVVLPKTGVKGERWWRVDEVQPKTGGFICRCVTSDSNPDFS